MPRFDECSEKYWVKVLRFLSELDLTRSLDLNTFLVGG